MLPSTLNALLDRIVKRVGDARTLDHLTGSHAALDDIVDCTINLRTELEAHAENGSFETFKTPTMDVTQVETLRALDSVNTVGTLNDGGNVVIP